MRGRTPYEAVEAFTRPLQLVLSCVARTALDIRCGYYPGSTHPLTLPDGDPVRLRGDTRLALAVDLRYVIDESPAPTAPDRWMVRIVTYIYTLYLPDDAVLLAYHWHPDGRSPITTPHLHLGSTVAHALLGGAHLPTGTVTLAQVVGLAIREFGTQPLRSDWPAVLDRAQAALIG